jgi:glycosyltransferase involved in cell wall biosynthesis
VQIHQVLVSASPGDAITNTALEIRSLLRRSGDSDIFARHVHPSLADDVIGLERYGILRLGARPRDDVLVYHASIGDSETQRFIMERRERVVLIYHNISPTEAFRLHDRNFAQLLEAGRQDLAPLRDRVQIALAVSHFNAAELVALGYSDVRVLPPIVDTDKLHRTRPDKLASAELMWVAGPVVLNVGQVLPHKRPEYLVEAFHVLSTYLLPEANLVLVGHPRLPSFRDAVQRQINELGLKRAMMTGQISAGTLRSFYDRADIFVTASDHEGFCVPLLEAMSFKVPIVARATSAIPETLGGAGLLVDPEDSPAVFAEAMAEVLTDPDLRDELVGRGSRRLSHFDADVARAELLEHLLSVV